jgi:galactokinase
MGIANIVEKRFRQLFNEQPLLVRSPGRVNLIGEHTDYNHGFVLPAAIDKAMYFAITPRTDGVCRVFARDMNEEFQFSLHSIQHSPRIWPDYLMGVVDQFAKAGYRIGGFNCVFGSNIPIGAGMSSSAALEAGLAFALDALFGYHIEPLTLVTMAQQAENEFVGVQCGIMDQFINIFGKEGNALLIDCRSLRYSYYPMDKNVSIVLFDTCVSHSHATSEYNRRREECNEGVDIIRKRFPEITHLRDVTREMIDRCRNEIPTTVLRRCSYVVEEIQRVGKACDALEKRDMMQFGAYMYQTHDGLSHGYEVSCPELDFLVDCVRDDRRVYGSRLMGGGFGGCTINIVENAAVEEVSAAVAERFMHQFNVEPKAYVTAAGSGTAFITAGDPVEAKRV